MKKFEYFKLVRSDLDASECQMLNDLGDSGWELVLMSQYKPFYGDYMKIYYFKREKKCSDIQ